MATIEARKNPAGRVTSWRVVWYEDGIKQKPRTFKSQQQAETWKHLVEMYKTGAAAQKALQQQSSRSPRFEEVARLHLERLVNVGPSTMYQYRNYLDLHLLPFFGGMPIDTITEDDCIRWVKVMKAKGLASKTIKNKHGLLYGIMSTAVAKKMIAESPCSGWYLPGDDTTVDAKVILSPGEFRTFLPYVDPHFQPWAWFMFTTGLRPSESYVIYPEDLVIDSETPQARVTKALKRDPSRGWYVGPPKTPKARRTVSFPRQVAEMLRPLVDATPYGEPIFRMKRGGVATVDSMGKSAIRPAVNRALTADFHKAPDSYSFRHSHASMMIQNGMDLFTLSRRLGHESVKMTGDTYSHLLPDVHIRSNAVLEQALATSPAALPA